MIDKIRLALPYLRICQRFVYLVRSGLHPLAVLPVLAGLRHFADVDFRVEVGGERHAVVARVAVHDIEVMYLVEVMFGGIGREYGSDAGVEAAAEDGRKPCLAEPVLIGPLP